ncbi:MAG: hypothetical protein WCE71_15835, partial [Pseudonocardiaceae bacterium]
MQRYADAERVRAGQRSRTRYSITEAGRKAMQAWLRTPPLPPLLEFQGLLRVLFADQGTVNDLQAALRATNEQARAMLEGRNGPHPRGTENRWTVPRAPESERAGRGVPRLL